MLTMTFGSAFEVEAEYPDGPNYRIYRAEGRAFMGRDTSENVHVCDEACALDVVRQGGERWTLCADGQNYVDLAGEKYTDGRPTDEFGTIDIGDFDAGDDPYVLCGACEAELLRDEDKFEAQYGRRIGA